MISHDLHALREFCSRVIWLDQGRILEDGPAANVIAAYRQKHGSTQQRASA
jgi:ABC-type polysaccharide/polyol phosphate transport system ATPase subunit